MNNVDVLRAIAVLSVFIHHIKYFYQLDVPFLGRFGGIFGVQLFFVISGYLIIQSAEKYSLRQYALHRFFRIYPVYLLTFFAIGIWFGVIYWEKIYSDPMGLISNMLLLQHFFPKDLLNYDSLHVSWTLTVELMWYLLAPSVVFLFRKQIKLTLFLSALISVLWVYGSALGVLDFIYTKQFSNMNLSLDNYRLLFINNSFIALLCFFLIGAFVYHKQNSLIRINSIILAFVFITCTLFYYIGVRPALNPNFITGIGLGALLLLALKLPTFYVMPVKFIADISYSFYLTHFTIILMMRDFGLHSKWYTICIFFMVVCVSAVLYFMVEKPMMELARKLSKKST